MRELPQEEKDRFGEIVFRFCFGSIYHLQHFNADAHPGNYLLMDDGKVAFLDFGMTKQLDKEQIELEIAAIEAVVRRGPGASCASRCTTSASCNKPEAGRRRAADGARARPSAAGTCRTAR